MSNPKELGDQILRKLVSLGIWRDVPDATTELKDGKIASGYGYPIIGLEKFLGYFDRPLNIANFPSISITTDFSYAVSYCRYVDEPAADIVSLDGSTERRYQEKAKKALSFFKNLYGVTGSFQFYVIRKKRYSDAKGLGESAAVASAVARSIVACALDNKNSGNDILVSRLARLVSGSGTRSATGGISLWLSYPYINERNCHAVRLPIDYRPLHFVGFPMKSKIITDDAHRLAESSPFYGRWLSEKFDRILEDLEGGFDLEHLLGRSQAEMYTLNSVILSTGNFIQTPESLRLIQDIREFSSSHPGLYYTADTGPSIILFSRDRSLIEDFLSNRKEQFLWGSVPEHPPDFTGIQKEADEFFAQNG